jgi:hypothetical protein
LTLILILWSVMENWRWWVARVQRNRTCEVYGVLHVTVPCPIVICELLRWSLRWGCKTSWTSMFPWMIGFRVLRVYPGVVDLGLVLPFVTCPASGGHCSSESFDPVFGPCYHGGIWLDINIAKWVCQIGDYHNSTLPHMEHLAQQENVMCNVNIRVYKRRRGHVFPVTASHVVIVLWGRGN